MVKDLFSSGFWIWFEVKDIETYISRRTDVSFCKLCRSRLVLYHAPHTILLWQSYDTHFIIRGFSLKLTRFATPTQFSLVSQNSISFRFFLSRSPDVTTKSNETIKTEAYISYFAWSIFCVSLLSCVWVMRTRVENACDIPALILPLAHGSSIHRHARLNVDASSSMCARGYIYVFRTLRCRSTPLPLLRR